MRKVLVLLGLTFISNTLLISKSSLASSSACTLAEVEQITKKLGTKQVNFEKLVQCGPTAVPALVAALQDSNQAIRLDAVSALDMIGSSSKPAAQALREILLDNRNQFAVRSKAAYALGNIGVRDQETVLVLMKALEIDSDELQAAAAYALGHNVTTENQAVQALIKVLESQEQNTVRASAGYALGEIAKENKEIIKSVAVQPAIQILQNKNQNNQVQAACIYLLGKVRETGESGVYAITSVLKEDNEDTRRQAGVALISIAEDLYSNANTLADIEKTSKIISNIQKFLNEAKSDNVLEIKLAQQSVGKTLQDLTYKQKALLTQILTRSLNNAGSILFTHAAFWLALIFAYPKFPQIQAIFFWNRYVRDILGLWYVTLLLTWVPFLRCKLFAPFKDSLLADARLDAFDAAAYFPDSEVKSQESGQTQSITAAFPGIKGQIILEGDSGLGKSMFLRHLAKHSQRIVVYLPAQKCDKGVIEAIQAKLHGQAQDAEFLKNLIYSGAIDICIDGLNEVTADTRAKIAQFVESYFKGNIIMTTQPIEWTPPSTAKLYRLQPLKREQIEQFLMSRYQAGLLASHVTRNEGQENLAPDESERQRIPQSEYEQACLRFLNQALSDSFAASQKGNCQLPEELAATRRILSNPMDLTIVSQMLAIGEMPDLVRLQEQQYTLMATDYQRRWKHEFPLKKFSHAVYQLRLNDEQALPAADFYEELLCMENEKYKMVVSRQWQDSKGEAKKEWYFRHDKIAEFFIMKAFLGNGEDVEQRLNQHMSDPRFRGVYFLLATLLPLDAAQRLREDLIQYAADTKDHTVSDTFIQLLRGR